MEAAAACLMQLESFFFVNNRGHDKKKVVKEFKALILAIFSVL